MAQNSKLVSFIRKAKGRGYSNSEIRNALINYGWKREDIEKAFAYLTPKQDIKNQICLFLSDDILNVLNKRAKKNMFTLSEQIEDILRRSCIVKRSSSQEKLDDFLISCFSRKRR